MSENTDFSALEWVKGEISESLRQAQHALEAYVANPKDSTKMQFCITHLHQVWGTLQMVELEGATLFALEMEQLAQAILDAKVPRANEAQEVLMQAFLQLPTYLDHLASGSKDMPVVLLPVLNDLRSTRGENLLSETAMFNPDLKAGHRIAAQREESQVSDLEDQLQKLRSAYQKSLVSVLQGEALEKNIEYMGKILARLQKLSGKSQLSHLWWMGGAMLDGLLNGSIEFSKSVSSLLGAIDRQIKILVDDHKKALAGEVSSELAKNILYYVAGGEPTTKRIEGVQKAYRLSTALPAEVRVEQSQQSRRGLVNEAIIAAVKVLVEDLLNINEVLDLVVRSKGKEDARLEELLPVVKSAAGALHVLALKEPRDIMAAQYKIIKACSAGKVADIKSELMGVAGQLLAVESNLNDIAKHGLSGRILIGEIGNKEKVSSDQLGVAQKALLNEAIVSLETVKELFAAVLASSWDHAVLQEAIAHLKSLAGSLKIIPLPLASEVLEKSAAYIKERLLTLDAAPNAKELETFADVLSSVDYFLEKLRTDSRSDDKALFIGSERLASLGFALGDTSNLASVTATVVEIQEQEELSEILSDEHEQQMRAEAEQAEAKAVDTFEETVVADELIVEQVQQVVVTQADDDEVIDNEIIEIFIEEVGEVQQTLNEFLPQWQANTDDEPALAEVRRAFHTLKGSGRMVGATALGEMAWSIENMLNRVIDRTIRVDVSVVQTVTETIDTVPELLELFKQGRNETTARADEIAARAEKLSKGESVEAVVVEALVSEEVPVLETLEQASVIEEAEEIIEEIEETEIPQPEYDMEIIEIFSQEALGHTEFLAGFIAECRDKVGPWVLSDDVLRVMHTLKGCANMAAVQPVAPVITKTENFIKELRLQDKKANEDVINLMDEAIQLTNGVIEELPKVSREKFAKADDILRTLVHLNDTLLSVEATELDGDSGKQARIDSFLKFAFDTIFDGEDYLGEYLDAQSDEVQKQANAENLKQVAEECKAIADIARQNQLDEIAELSHTLAISLVAAQQNSLSEAFVKDLSTGMQRLTEIVDFLAAGQFIKSPAKLTAKLQEHLQGLPGIEFEEAPPLAVVSEEIVIQEEIEQQEIEDIHLELPTVIEEEMTEDVQEFAQIEPEIETIIVENVMDADIERDEEIVGIFLEEAEELIENSASLLDQWQDNPNDLTVVAELQRDLHTLKGGARMAEFAAIGDLGHELENIYEAVGAGHIEASSELFNLLFRCHDRISEMFSDIRDKGNCYRADDLLSEINMLVNCGVAEVETVEVLEEHIDVQLPVETFETETKVEIEETDFEIEQEIIAAVAEEDEGVLEDITAAEASKLLDAGDDSELDVELELVEIFLEEAEEITESSASALEAWRNDSSNTALVEQLQRELHTLKGGARMAQIPQIGDFAHEMENVYEGLVGGTLPKSEVLINLLFACHDRLNEMVSSLKQSNTCDAADDLVEQLKLALQGKLGEVVTKASSKPQVKTIELESGIDVEVIKLFLADGMELFEQLHIAVANLHEIPEQRNNAQLKEVLASLSGGANLSGFKSLGRYCESFSKESDTASSEELQARLASIQAFVNVLKQAEAKTDKPVQAAVPAKAAAKKPEAKKSTEKQAANNADNQAESIKISANLLETLVNLAGETSINRGRLEMQMSEFAFTIDEMGGTIERLQEQLRRLHLETEAQIISRYEKEGPSAEEAAAIEAMEANEDFDPLEMDKYSTIDQLSRSLSESASDLLDLKEALMNKTRDAETLLLQQGRINTELQEGLMRSRMVPFSRLLPRLRRIVRQVGNELKKPVDLEILNAEGELDRAVLERMISPIEHMLRNSIAHGIEKAEDRKKTNKPKNGTISIDLGREGSNMVIAIKDDGAGINIEAVRKKAIENGLMDARANLPEHEIAEFIFNPGFSTASEVSQVAGRGVGMDVVASEIKSLNGTIETRSVTGVGTTFIIRLPFTVAVNRALMVNIGDAFYAIPLTSIEGVVRVSPYELEAYYEQEYPVFNYAGVDYHLQYLGSYMKSHERPHLLGQTRPIPVLLVRSSEYAVAMQVDSLMGSREVVVKSVGPQLSTVAGISGATILGDGSVVIILDIHSMIRGALAQRESDEAQETVIEARRDDRPTKVMVVDDSVTVRKVTSRLLERHGMEVVLAKDGMDAITQLQEIKPDIMLLDIEMPRMDGFEVATLVRHDERLQDVPIIMITSRTGEKHKQRAMEIGVNRYMGKPFQENALLATIKELISEREIV